MAATTTAEDAVINVPNENVVNRLSALQQQILTCLAAYGQPHGSYIGGLLRTGDIVDHIGRRRDKAGFASVSRALRRLERAGLVSSYQSEVCTRGKGYRYALARPVRA